MIGETFFHRLREGQRRAQRSDHDGELVDHPLVVRVKEVAALNLSVADACTKHKGVVSPSFRADLAHEAKVLEDLRDGAQDRADRLASMIWRKDNRASEDDVLVQQRKSALPVSCLESCTKRMHRPIIIARACCF